MIAYQIGLRKCLESPKCRKLILWCIYWSDYLKKPVII